MKKTIFSVITTLVISGCSFSEDALYPSLFTPSQEEAPAAENQVKIAPKVSAPTFETIKVAEVRNTGTLVGQKVISFKKDLENIQKSINYNSNELQKIREAVVLNSASYHKTLAAIETKLQVGTTPGNPEVYKMLNSIQANIQSMDANAIALEQISRKATADADLSASLLDSIRSTYVVSGAVDEDHRQLRILENETAQTSIMIQSVLSEINTDYARQVQYSQTAKNYINDLSKAVRMGSFVGVATQLPAYQSPVKSLAKPEYNGVTSPALMSINFSNGAPAYKEALKNTMREVLSRRATANFDIVSVNSATSSNANAIFQEMVNAGVNPDNINISAVNDGSEGAAVQIFVK